MVRLIQLARIVKTLWQARGNAPGNAIVVQLSSGGEQERTAEFYQLPGVASGPTKEDRAVVVPTGSGYRVVVASHNYRVGVEVSAGETIIYSTNAAGDTKQAEIHLGADGKISIANTAEDLTTVLNDLLDELIAFKTFGSPSQHTTDPATVTNLNTIKTALAGIMEEAS